MYNSIQNVQCTEENSFCNKYHVSLLVKDGLPHPLQILLDSSCPVTLFFHQCPAASSELSSPWQNNPSPRPEAQHLSAHLKCPGLVKSETVLVKCWELPKKKGYCCSRENCF